MDMIKNMAFLDYLFDGIYLIDKNQNILFGNQSAEKISGYATSSVVGQKSCEDILLDYNESRKIPGEVSTVLKHTVEDSLFSEKAVYLRHKEGSLIPVTIRSIPLIDDDDVSRITLVAFTKTIFIENNNQVKDLARKAYVDTLTGLPNKEYIDSKLKSLLTSNEISNNNTLGLFFIHLDNLKQINDMYGTLAGDMTLKAISKTLFENKHHTNDIVSRWEGGLFFILTHLDKKFLMLNWAAKLKNLLQETRVPGYNKLSMDIYLSGVIAPLGENVDILYNALEEELKISHNSTSSISIRDLPPIK
jgi:diguanylate cyclase (GGDEF)-like protein/PAS domain S-box-containing protein